MTEVIALIHAKVGAPVSIGAKFKGKVVKIINSGIFVNYTGTKDGFVHISEIANERIEDIQQHVREGEMVSVVVIGIDHQKVRLSISKANDPDAIANLSNHSTQPSKPKYNSNNTYRNQKYSKSRHSDRTSEHDGQNGHGGRKYFN
jgi:polyribonucleotide nucleotidyltransferase